MASQVLVYSKTSINAAFITARNPRAIYFTDDAYVAWVPGSGEIEGEVIDVGEGLSTLGLKGIATVVKRVNVVPRTATGSQEDGKLVRYSASGSIDLRKNSQ